MAPSWTGVYRLTAPTAYEELNEQPATLEQHWSVSKLGPKGERKARLPWPPDARLPYRRPLVPCAAEQMISPGRHDPVRQAN